MKTKSAMQKPGFRGIAGFLSGLLLLTLNAAASDALIAGKIGETSVLSTPGKLAVDSQLAVYAVDTYKNRVQKFDRTGNLIGSIKAERPCTVAGGRDGFVYIGSHRDYSVGIYKNGKRTGQFGDGSGEFSSILDLAVDDMTGDVYVADALRNSVRIYTASGTPRGSFSGFNAPLAIALTYEDVYVLDSPVINSLEGPGTGSRISVFSKSGTQRWSVDERSGQNRHMSRPVDIAVDGMGNIFVADAGKNAVLVYDNRGSFVGQITGPPNVINSAVALALSRDNRLYVSSGETNSIVEIGLGGTVYAGAKVSLDFRSGTGAGLTPAVLGYQEAHP